MTTTVEPSAMSAQLAKARAAKAAPTDKWGEREDLVKRLAAANAALKDCRARKRPFALASRRGGKAAADRLAAIDRDQQRAAAMVEELTLAIDGLDVELAADQRREQAASLRQRWERADAIADDIGKAGDAVDAAVTALMAAVRRRAALLDSLRGLRVLRGEVATIRASSSNERIAASVLGRLANAFEIGRYFDSDRAARSAGAVTRADVEAAISMSRARIEAELAEFEAEPDEDEA